MDIFYKMIAMKSSIAEKNRDRDLRSAIFWH